MDELDNLLDALDDEVEEVQIDLEDVDDRDGIDRFDGPASWFEPGDTVFAKDKKYVFCPAPHRSQVLHMFIRHFCEHPLLPDRLASTRTAEQIYHDAVHDMYKFCHQRGLREVWGYMWTAWYCPEKYKLWARSTQPNRIGHWRTTMAVENFWRNLKRNTLRDLLRPRLDKLIFLIVTEVLPSFTAKLQIFDPNYRSGRAPALTPFQSEFKRNWNKLAERSLGTHIYQTDVQRWICDCGQQKYNPYPLCKHLVQSLAPPPPNFFTEVVRRRVIPFYYHPSLKLKDGTVLPEPDFIRSVSNGDPVETIQATDLTLGLRGAKRKRAGPKPTPSEDAMEENPVNVLVPSSSPILADEYSDDVLLILLLIFFID